MRIPGINRAEWMVYMKRIVTLLMTAVCLSALLFGCKSSPSPAPSGSSSPSASKPSSSAPSSPSPPSSSAGSAKTGLAVLTALSKSTDAGQDNGLAEVDSTVIAVTVDSKGKIQKCVIDAVSAQIYFDVKGQLITLPTTTFKTKNELADTYGLKKASGIGKEWYEQAAAFAKYVEGMTAEQVMGIKVDEKNYTTQSDLKASVTISIGGFIKCLEKAIKMAQSVGAAEADRLSIGIVTTMSKSISAAGDKPGLVQVNSTYAAITRDAGGKISGCVLDASQGNINFTAMGKITTDLSVTPQTKDELGEAYGLKKESGIGKEWMEQAAAFAKYVTGKTAAEVEGIAVDEKGYAIPADIKSSVTISIGDFVAALTKATATV
jgi:hypothetical protein